MVCDCRQHDLICPAKLCPHRNTHAYQRKKCRHCCVGSSWKQACAHVWVCCWQKNNKQTFRIKLGTPVQRIRDPPSEYPALSTLPTSTGSARVTCSQEDDSRLQWSPVIAMLSHFFCLFHCQPFWPLLAWSSREAPGELAELPSPVFEGLMVSLLWFLL